jgi:hypothetical protein
MPGKSKRGVCGSSLPPVSLLHLKIRGYSGVNLEESFLTLNPNELFWFGTKSE